LVPFFNMNNGDTRIFTFFEGETEE
jgi:hypothetical protein